MGVEPTPMVGTSMPEARSDSAKRVVTSRSASPTATISAELAAPYEWPIH